MKASSLSSLSSPSSFMSSPASSSFSPGPFSLSYEYDVFLSFRGEDVRKGFVDHFYTALVDRQIRTYKDDQTLRKGESIGPSLIKAIEESRIAVVIFSKNYAGSSWCLDELMHIMKGRNETDLMVVPIFYDVEPTDVRNLKRKFGEAFNKENAMNIAKAESWREALAEICKISGWELNKVTDGHESQFIKKVIDTTILDGLFERVTGVDEDLVGMSARLQELELLLDMGSGGVRMVGIWGLGGSGKTTLGISLKKRISKKFHDHCTLENIREETRKYGLQILQEKILSTLTNEEANLQSVGEGKDMIRSRLCHRKVLLLLDDVDALCQLEALAGYHNWFGSGSRIIITTRDQHLLRTHKVDHILPTILLSEYESIQLFNRHAFKGNQVKDYETLSLLVVSYAAGLPLALKVLGSFLYGKTNDEWISVLEKLKEIPDPNIIEILKISYDGLETYQKMLFLDIACFWRHRYLGEAEDVLEASGYHPKIGIKVLTEKALITIDVKGKLNMHDLIQEMGHYIVRGEHPNNPAKHTRVWKEDELKTMCFGDPTMENEITEAIRYDYKNVLHDPYNQIKLSHVHKIVSNMKKLKWFSIINPNTTHNVAEENDGKPIFRSSELRYIKWIGCPARNLFAETLQPMNLSVLKLEDSLQKELWKGWKHLPRLKVLELKQMTNLVNTPDFDGLPCLQTLVLEYCYELEEIHSSLGNHRCLEYIRIFWCQKLRMFPTISRMEKLKTLIIENCHLTEIPSGICELSNLQEINLSSNSFSRLDFSLPRLTQLKVLSVSECHGIIELPNLPSSLAVLNADRCSSLTNIGDFHKNLNWLCQVSVTGGCLKNAGRRLLQSLLEGNHIENGSFVLRLASIEIAMSFTPPMLRGSRFRLQLPENWSHDFSGFLMCIVLPAYNFYETNIDVIMNDVISGVDSQCDRVWDDSDRNNGTWVGYVSFGSLRHTSWWDQTHKSIEFNIGHQIGASGIVVRLVEKKRSCGQSTILYSGYKPMLAIQHDSTSELAVSLGLSTLHWKTPISILESSDLKEVRVG